MATGVCVVPRYRILFRVDLKRFNGLRTITINNALISSVSSSFRHSSILCHLPNETQQTWSRRGKRYYTKSIKQNNEDNTEVTVKYIQGLPHLTVPLPSRNEKCRFALKPVSHNVGDLINMLKSEDRGIDRAAVLNEDGIRIASTCTIESLMDEPFWLYVNDKKYKVTPPKREKISTEELTKLGDVRAVVAQLYEALHVGEYHIKKEKDLLERLENLRYQLTPLEEQKTELNSKAVRRTNLMTWVGLGLMSVQFGILARLTWWEYSWDIMEPVTYFVTYGTAMAAYAYFCITKQEYNYPDVRDRQYLITIHKRAKKKGFDVHTYNNLKREIAEIEYDLRRLRDPLNLQLPPHLERSKHGPSSVGHISSTPSSPSSTSSSPSVISLFSSSGSADKSSPDSSSTKTQSNLSKIFNITKKIKKTD